MAIQSAETVRDFLIEGLRNAHAMESQAISLTSGQAERLKHYADLEQRVRQHLKETEGQRDRLERCLEKFGASPSTLKDAALKTGANLQMMLHSMASDEVVKNVLASFAFESFEIITYKALIETAKLDGDPGVIGICEENLREEEAMAGGRGDGRLARPSSSGHHPQISVARLGGSGSQGVGRGDGGGFASAYHLQTRPSAKTWRQSPPGGTIPS